MTRARWLRGADLGPDELQALGAVAVAVLRRLDAAREAAARDGDDEDAHLVSTLIDTPLAHVLQEAVEFLNSRVRADRALGRPFAPHQPAVDLAWLADSLTYTEGIAPEAIEERARFALLLDPTCVDALTQLGWRAEEAGDLALAEERYTRAVTVATARLEPGRLTGSHKDDDFWLGIDQRPYMRARAALARLYWRTGRVPEAAAIYRDLVRLAPHDGQGNRYCLASALAEAGDYAGARRALDRHCRDDASADVLWPRALVAFALAGEGPAAAALALALHENPHVPAYLLDRAPIPWHPDHYSHGSVEEALCYVDLGRGGWMRTPGALSWLQRVAGQGWAERQETEAVLARTTLRPDHRRLTHYRAVRALAELAARQPGANDDGALLRAVPAVVIVRFWRTLVGTERGCWLWAGSTTLRHKGQQATLDPELLAHAIVGGRAIPPTAQLLASCGTPGCVNPQHHHNIEVLAPEGIAAELEARLGGTRTREACLRLVTRALTRTSLEGGLRDSAIAQPERGGPLVRRELVDPWLDRQQAPDVSS